MGNLDNKIRKTCAGQVNINNKLLVGIQTFRIVNTTASKTNSFADYNLVLNRYNYWED